MAQVRTLPVASSSLSGFSWHVLAARILALAAVARQRRALGRLTDQELLDLGLTREQANSESGRHFWDVPANWRA